MHKVKSSARQRAWLTDGSQADYNSNPFAKVRKPSVYAEPEPELEDDDRQKFADSENFVAELVRRGTRKLTFAKSDHLEFFAKRRSTVSPHTAIDEEKPQPLIEDQLPELQEFTSPTWKQRAFLIWRQWRSQAARFGLGSQWEVKPAIAGVATSTISFAPLSATGQYFLPATARPPQTLTIDYDIDHSATIFSSPAVYPAHVKPSSAEIKLDYVQRDKFSGLEDLTNEIINKEKSTILRVIYVQDDTAAFNHIISDFHLHSPAFSRSRTNFRDWVHGEDADHLSVWQTALWRPSYDRSRNVVRAAFGLQYLVPQIQSVSVMESQSRFSKRRRVQAVVESSNDDVHDNSLQRLSVYIQVPRDPAFLVTTNPPGDDEDVATRDLSGQDRRKNEKMRLASERTVVILDSRLKAIATTPLISHTFEEPWQQLVDYLDDPNSHSAGFALTVVGLAFEAVAARWVHYILCMHGYIASLEERVYENPADDTRTNALWSVSKQLLQAERLLKFHILLLENIQNDFGGLYQEGTMPTDWLRPNLDEFRRLSSEVEETLKKPTVHMVDLVSLRMLLGNRGIDYLTIL